MQVQAFQFDLMIQVFQYVADSDTFAFSFVVY